MTLRKRCGHSRNERGGFLSEEARAALDTFTKLEEQYIEVTRKRAEGERQIDMLKRQMPWWVIRHGVFSRKNRVLLTILNQRLLDVIQERNTLLSITADHPQVVEQQRKIDNVRSR